MKQEKAKDSLYYHHSSHATYNLTGHLVWITKYRRKALTPEIIERLTTFIEWICKERYIIILTLGFEEDHVHCLLSLPITSYIPTVVKYLKGRTSKVIWDEFHDHLRKFYFSKIERHLWAIWYFFASVGRVDEEKVMQQKKSTTSWHSELENIVLFWRSETVETCIGDLSSI